MCEYDLFLHRKEGYETNAIQNEIFAKVLASSFLLLIIKGWFFNYWSFAKIPEY
ncbi:hypothetical protein SAMN05216419_10408 [Nitrosomonas cryotolerans]|uniref:Uncharacterized protein n=1 Tax=Nitrosomonas cryotolerans ATCC 49181 TaxID=1131553 RepID=A0A1N6I7V2_9PROT|nr:hypothetical protein SAMN05216419_10408 [Nitrosomonas cryotolerans]SIO28025.1 hypothetical protein SAMN02743940_1605 [Nitrosomonas cryotolerans ATCC 49181]